MHAIQGFDDSLRSELLHDASAVRVTDVHLPALNTPQFAWVKSRLPFRAQPVPPIHQPEIAADAIVHAMREPRREIWVGWSTVKAIVGNRLAPGFGDRYLAENGVESQQIQGRPATPDRPHNLWSPVDADKDFGAHGDFDDVAIDTTAQLWLVKNRRLLLQGALVAGLALTAGIVARRREIWYDRLARHSR